MTYFDDVFRIYLQDSWSSDTELQNTKQDC